MTTTAPSVIASVADMPYSMLDSVRATGPLPPGQRGRKRSYFANDVGFVR
jgi:hypothetical protein